MLFQFAEVTFMSLGRTGELGSHIELAPMWWDKKGLAGALMVRTLKKYSAAIVYTNIIR